MLTRFVHISVVIILLLSQGVEAFAVSSEMPCMQEHNMMSEMSMSGSHFDNMAVDENSEDCCPKDCCCPMGLLIVAVLVDSRLNGLPDYTAIPFKSIEPSIKKAFLHPIQRPPKTPLYIS